jgi:hypothetical protein
MHNNEATDYQTYKEIMGELLHPIQATDLDADTLKRLYESKLVYLENLRVKCFYELNSGRESHFRVEDYQLILKAVRQTKKHTRELILLAITSNLQRRKIS